MGPEGIGRYTYGKTPALMAQLEIEYSDGSRETVVTDASWKVTGAGPIQEADFLMGEAYDASREMPGWCKPGFDDSKWEPAIRAEANGSVRAKFYEFHNPLVGKARRWKAGRWIWDSSARPGWRRSRGCRCCRWRRLSRWRSPRRPMDLHP